MKALTRVHGRAAVALLAAGLTAPLHAQDTLVTFRSLVPDVALAMAQAAL